MSYGNTAFPHLSNASNPRYDARHKKNDDELVATSPETGQPKPRKKETPTSSRKIAGLRPLLSDQDQMRRRQPTISSTKKTKGEIAAQNTAAEALAKAVAEQVEHRNNSARHSSTHSRSSDSHENQLRLVFGDPQNLQRQSVSFEIGGSTEELALLSHQESPESKPSLTPLQRSMTNIRNSPPGVSGSNQHNMLKLRRLGTQFLFETINTSGDSSSPPPITDIELTDTLEKFLQNIFEEASSLEAARGAEHLAQWLKQLHETLAASAKAEAERDRATQSTTTEAKPSMQDESIFVHSTPQSPIMQQTMNRSLADLAATKTPKALLTPTTTHEAVKKALGCGEWWTAERHCGPFAPSIKEGVIFGASVGYGVIYGIISQFKGREALGSELASGFAIFSGLANFAQIFITIDNLPTDIKKNFKNLTGYINTALTFCLQHCLSEGKIEVLSKILTGLITLTIAALSVITAASLASATAAATGSQMLAHLMWGFRSLLVFKSSIGIIDTLKGILENLYERIQVVRNGDESLLRALIETAFIAFAGYIAAKYSTSQEIPMGEFAAHNLNGLFSSLFNIDLTQHESLLHLMGLGPLLALNVCFIVGGAEKFIELCDKFHPTLALSLFLTAFTGFPGVALIHDPDLQSTLIAYLSAVLSNYASVAKLSYVTEKREKDNFINQFEATHLMLSTLRAEHAAVLRELEEKCDEQYQENSTKQQEIITLLGDYDSTIDILGTLMVQLRSVPTTTFERSAEVIERIDSTCRDTVCCISKPTPINPGTPVATQPVAATSWWSVLCCSSATPRDTPVTTAPDLTTPLLGPSQSPPTSPRGAQRGTAEAHSLWQSPPPSLPTVRQFDMT